MEVIHEADLADLIIQLKMNQARKEPLSVELIGIALEIIGKHLEEDNELYEAGFSRGRALSPLKIPQEGLMVGYVPPR